MSLVFYFLELVVGIEPTTASLRMKCSAIEPHQPIIVALSAATKILYYNLFNIASKIFKNQ